MTDHTGPTRSPVHPPQNRSFRLWGSRAGALTAGHLDRSRKPELTLGHPFDRDDGSPETDLSFKFEFRDPLSIRSTIHALRHRDIERSESDRDEYRSIAITNRIIGVPVKDFPDRRIDIRG